ncbi:MAG: tetratricopeptide repeat protein [Methanospirillum sp.]|nr:tetratricopeptide repeat protein [Methanospirillum sp.]
MLFSLCLIFPPAFSAELKGKVVDAVSYYNQAVDAASNSSPDEALVLIDKSLALNPDFHLALVTKAGILIDAGRYVEAETCLNKADSIKPADPYVNSSKASLYVNTVRYRESLESAEKALGEDPSLVEAWVLKGTACGALGEYEEEINASSQALTLDPRNTKARSNYEYARQAINQNQSINRQENAQKSPLPGFVALGACFFSVCFYRVSRR